MINRCAYCCAQLNGIVTAYHGQLFCDKGHAVLNVFKENEAHEIVAELVECESEQVNVNEFRGN